MRNASVFGAALILAVLVVIAFGSTLSAGFQSDDFYLISRAEDGFYTSWGGRTGADFFRPGMIASLSVDLLLWGADPAGFHATNLALHFMSCMLVMILAKDVFNRAGLKQPALFGFLAACLFAVIPSHSESVCWVSGRTDLLATAFALGATVLFLRRRVLPALLLYAAGSLCKESVVVLPWMWLLIPRSDRGRGRLAGTLLLLAAPVAYAGFRVLSSPGFLHGITEGAHVSSAGWSPGENLFRFVTRAMLPPLPGGLETVMTTFPPALALIPLLLLTVPIVILIVRRKPSRSAVSAMLVLLGCFMIALLPVLRIKVALFDTQSERLLYFPGVAFLLMTVLLLVSMTGEGRLSVAILAAATAAGCVSTVHAARNWSRAGELCSGIAGELSTIPPGCTAIVNLPDNLNGAYVFRNGLDEAVAMAGGADMQGTPRVMSTHSISSLDDPVDVRLEGDSIRITIPGGERFCSVDGVPQTGRAGGTVTLPIPGDMDRILYYSSGLIQELPAR